MSKSRFSIVKCSQCKQLMALESFELHKCDLPLKECKTIEVIYFQDGSYKDKKLMMGMGIDGVLYTFEVVPRKPIPITIPLTDEKKQVFRTDEEEPVPFQPIYKGGLVFPRATALHVNCQSLHLASY